MQVLPQQYGSFRAVTPSNTNPINCRAIYVGDVSPVTLNVQQTSGGPVVSFSCGQIGLFIPIELNGGFVIATSTATNIVACA